MIARIHSGDRLDQKVMILLAFSIVFVVFLTFHKKTYHFASGVCKIDSKSEHPSHNKKKHYLKVLCFGHIELTDAVF